MTIGERIKIRRIELGMTQLELANRLGYRSKSTINKIELGIQSLQQSKIKEIAVILLTTPDYIIGWNETDDTSLNKQEGFQNILSKHDCMVRYAESLLQNLSDLDLKSVTRIMESLLKNGELEEKDSKNESKNDL